MPHATLSYYDEAGGVRVFRAAGDSFTVGSDGVCELTIPGLAPTACRIYLAERGFYVLDLDGGVAIDDHPGPGYLRDGGTLTLGGWLSLRFTLEPDAAPVAAARPPVRSAPERRVAVAVAPGTRRHRPGTAVALGLLAGGGQAYNGQPFKAAFVLLTSVVLVPWVWSLFDARAVARRIAAAGGRRGRGGPLWFVLHGWLAVNLALLTALVLTLAGALS